MKRTSDATFFSCPICGKNPYVKTYNLNYGTAYCNGTLLKRHPLIQVKTKYCNPSKLFKILSGGWNGVQWKRLNSSPIIIEIEESSVNLKKYRIKSNANGETL